MGRIVKKTEDGSSTLYVTDLNETYHSTHGALQEAEHVFINNGIKKINKSEINILELGFGTGLNVLCTINEYLKNSVEKKINYFTIEKYPLEIEEALSLQYNSLFDKEVAALFSSIHGCEWEKITRITREFYLMKIRADFFDLKNIDLSPIDVVYFDCFGSRVQPDLWEETLIKMVTDKMTTGALFTTYSSKGSLKRILKSLNFEVEKLDGPKGKREMINAWKK